MDGLKSALAGIGFIILILVSAIGLAYGVCWVDAHYKAKVLNARYGTDYRTSEVFWLGDSLVVSDYTDIK